MRVEIIVGKGDGALPAVDNIIDNNRSNQEDKSIG